MILNVHANDPHPRAAHRPSSPVWAASRSPRFIPLALSLLCPFMPPRLPPAPERERFAALALRGALRRTSFSTRVVATALTLFSAVCHAQPHTVRVAVVTDAPSAREPLSIATIEQEVINVAANDVAIEFPVGRRFAGDGSIASIDAQLDRALADGNTDMVLTLGVLASDRAAHRPALNKPVIALGVIDPVLQGYPLVDSASGGMSGRRNFTYVADFHGLREELATFQRMTGFHHLAVLIDDGLMRNVPQLESKAAAAGAELQARVSLVPVSNDAAAALAAVPSDADAVYVAGLLRFDARQLADLSAGLQARRLPSFSAMGRDDVEGGLLMSAGGLQRERSRFARRIVLTLQRLAQGTPAAEVEVAFATEQRLQINMHTARAIGFSPTWADLADAELIEADARVQPAAVSLLDAMRAALEHNPALAATRARLYSDAEDVRIARSSLLPSVDATATRTAIDADRAHPLTQSERSTSAGFSMQQVIYSERAWAGYSVSKWLHHAAEQEERQAVLDTLADTAAAYLDVLRAKSLEDVRRANVENTRRNLETARVRANVGLAGRADLLRWQAELARDKQDLLAAQSTRGQAETELARLMHRPATQPFAVVATNIDEPLDWLSHAGTRALLDTPAKWAMFTTYAVDTALRSAPETARADAIMASRQRSLTAARRAYWVPDIALVSSNSSMVHESGAGATHLAGMPDDHSWSVSLQVTLPIFNGQQRAAELAQARHELRASEADRAAAADAVEARARVALHRTASSYPAIALAAEAAAAANENLLMVADAYTRGVVSITDLIDAQDTALSAGLAAADAKYAFLTDFVGVLRATNELDVLLDPYARAAWQRRLAQWSSAHTPSAGN